MNEIEKKKIEQDRLFKAEKERRIKKDKTFFRIIFAVLTIVVLSLLTLLVYMLVTADERAEEAFDSNILLVQQLVIHQKNIKQENTAYEYYGIPAESDKEAYAKVYQEIEALIGIEIDEDFYILAEKQLISANVQVTGSYLVNYERELVFSLVPFKTDKVYKYTTQEMIDNFEIGKIIDKSNANEPVIYDGMKPIVYNENSSKWEYVQDVTSTWYNYGTKQWANAVLSDGKSEDGTVNGSMYVWIPRFAYKIPSYNYHTIIKTTIDIVFLKGNTDEAVDGTIIDSNNTDASMGYVIHPAFQAFGEVEGIWVSKYEASTAEYGDSGKNYGGGNDATLTYKSLPDKYSWNEIDINTSFIASKNMIDNPIYGLNKEQVNTHMMKNIEWGAIAYLTHSKYGRADNVVWSNNYFDNSLVSAKTGYGSKTADDINFGTAVNAVTYKWDTTNGSNASTTGNVYGVYDMVGGSTERVAAYLNNGAKSLSDFGLSLLNEKNLDYVDVYNVNGTDSQDANYQASSQKCGDAIYETSASGSASNTSWFGVSSAMPANIYAFFFRGGIGSSVDGNRPGMFFFSPSSGGTYELSTFRTVITKNR